MTLNLLDVCAGIGSFSLAAHRAGIETIAQVELEAKRRDVLATHFPDVLRLEDIRNVTTNDIPKRIDILAGGTPCQDLSVAGQRAGLDGNKSQIWYEYLRLAQELKPQWVVWENVPGALSSNGGRDFLTILRGLDECGYHVAWRVLDAQYFGVPQRRRRIFLVGHLGDGRAAKVLFEPKSVPGNSNTRPKTRQRNSRKIATLAGSGSGTNRPGGQGVELDMVVYRNRAFGDYEQDTVGRSILSSDDVTNSDLVMTFSPSYLKRGFGIAPAERSTYGTLTSEKGRGYSDTAEAVLAFNPQASSTASRVIRDDDKTGTLGTTRIEGVLEHSAPRRLTPLECERLQGFPDGWTEGYSDSARYSMLGDSIAVPCSEWIMKRLVAIA